MIPAPASATALPTRFSFAAPPVNCGGAEEVVVFWGMTTVAETATELMMVVGGMVVVGTGAIEVCMIV